MAQSPRFCVEKQYSFRSWGEFAGYQYPRQDLQKLIGTLDEFAGAVIDNSPKAILGSLFDAATFFTNFQFKHLAAKWSWLLTVIDLLSALSCVLGLFLPSYRFVSAFCLATWFIPMCCHHLTAWDMRYTAPMAGLPIAVGFAVLMTFRRKLARDPELRYSGSNGNFQEAEASSSDRK